MITKFVYDKELMSYYSEQGASPQQQDLVLVSEHEAEATKLRQRIRDLEVEVENLIWAVNPPYKQPHC